MCASSKPLQYVSRNCLSSRSSVIMTWANPATRAASVPGRIGTHSSARFMAVSLYRGSMMITRWPDLRFTCWVTNVSPPPLMRVSCGLFPNITTSFEFTRSSLLFEPCQKP